jgi:hypothetical protein
MNHYSYTENPFHPCDAEGCTCKSKYQVYPSGQPAGIMHGSTMMCNKHFKLFEKRYWESVDAFYNSVMKGDIQNRVHIITHG